MNADMYVSKESDGFYTLRQRRFAAALKAGKEHPHDVCAVALGLDELRGMCEKHWPDVDYTQTQEVA